MVYLQGHANFNEFWVTNVSKLQSILFFFHNFGQLLTILRKLHSILTNFNQLLLTSISFCKLPNNFCQLQLASANFQPIFHTSVSFQRTVWKGGWKVGNQVSVFDQKWVKTFFVSPAKKNTWRNMGYLVANQKLQMTHLLIFNWLFFILIYFHTFGSHTWARFCHFRQHSCTGLSCITIQL